MILKNALYFPESPVNSISITCLADTFDDDSGTYIKTSRYASEFCWDSMKYCKSIIHNEGRIPEVSVTRSNQSRNVFVTTLNIFTSRINLKVSLADEKDPEDVIISLVTTLKEMMLYHYPHLHILQNHILFTFPLPILYLNLP